MDKDDFDKLRWLFGLPLNEDRALEQMLRRAHTLIATLHLQHNGQRFIIRAGPKHSPEFRRELRKIIDKICK